MFLTIFSMIIWEGIATICILLQNKQISKLNKQIRQENNKGYKVNRVIKRNHSQINPVNFSNPIQSRKYKDYENEKGLYEPVTPSKGIEIKKEDN